MPPPDSVGAAEGRRPSPPRIELRLLGPFELLRDGEAVTVPGDSLRRLLALLALHEGTVLTITDIIRALWNDDPPATATRQVRNNVSRLRRILPWLSIEGRGDGYRLAPTGFDLDVRDFHADFAAAWRHRRDGDAVAALAALRRGLDRWRGPALAGLTGEEPADGLAGRARGLDDAGLDAIELRTDLELSRGLTPPTAELSRLSQRNPYRQRLAGLLMSALYREGRTPEALTVYHSLRDRLVEELGIDPEPALRDRYEAIRRGDFEPAVPVPKPAARRPEPAGDRPVPAQLPADIAGFTGRAGQLAMLDALSRSGTGTAVLSTVSGTGGVGKTALAVHWGHRNRHRYPDGQLYLNLRGFDPGEPVSATDALGRLLTALGVPGDRIPEDVAAAAGRFRTLLADRRMLLILDNARSSDQVTPLIPGGDGNLTIITSRNRLTSLTALHGARPVAVEPLATNESLLLLDRLLGTGRAAAEPDAAGRLVELCGGLPLALRIAAANHSVRPESGLAEFVTVLDGAQRLDRLAVDGDPRATVAAVFDQSLAVLDDRTRSDFLRLGLLPCDTLTARVASAVLDTTVPAATELLRRLSSACLIEQHSSTRFRFHDLVRAHAGARAESLDADVRESAITRCVRWYFDHRSAADRAEHSNLVALVDAWRDRADGWRLVTALSFLISSGTDLNRIRDHVDRALTDTTRRSDVEGQFHLHTAAARIRVAATDADGSVAAGERALECARKLGGRDLSIAKANLGTYVTFRGEFARGRDHLRQALREFDDRGDPQAAPIATNLANACRRLGEFAEAERLLRRSRRLYRETGNRTGELNADIGLGLVDLNRGDLEAGVTGFRDCLAVAVELGASRHETLCHLGLGMAYAGLGRTGDGERELRLTLEQARSAGLSGEVNKAGDSLAMLLARLGRTDAALELLGAHDTASLAAMGVGRQLDHALASCAVLAPAGRVDAAIDAGELALDLAARHRVPLDEAHALSALAEAHTRTGDPGAARGLRERARSIFAELGARAETSVR